MLRHGNMCIPFHTRLMAGLVDPGTGKPFFTSEIISFGTSIFLKGDRNVPDHEFSSDEGARRWRRIAAEAVLIYGLAYDGLDLDPDYVPLILDGEVLTRRDFGYTR